MREETPTIAIFGVGNLGSAIATGLSRSALAPKLLLVDRAVEKCQKLVDSISRAQIADSKAAVKDADILILAVKPVHIGSLCEDISEVLAVRETKPLVISVAASPTLAETRAALGYARVVRVMPSIAVSVCEGIVAVYSDSENDQNEASALFEELGAVLRVKTESEFDAVLGMCASGLGFLALVAESLAEGGAKMGLSPEDALQCAAHTMLGAGLLLCDGSLNPTELREKVSSPGGTTIAGLQELEKAGVREAFINAIEAAVVKARER